MVDLIPEGCISLSGAFDLFASRLWNGHSPTTELHNENIYRNAPAIVADECRASLARVTDQMLAEMVHAFASGSLDALVRPSGANENSAIPEDTWREAFFPERLFLSATIVRCHGGYWDGLIGRIPFVRRAQFDPWLAARMERRRNPDAMRSPADRALVDHLVKLTMNGFVPSSEIEAAAQTWGLEPFASKPPPAEFDPMSRARWTLCMAISWIVWGSVDEVRNVMDDYRARTRGWVSYEALLPLNGGSDCYEVRGEQLQALDPMSLSTLGMLEAFDEDEGEPAKRRTVRRAREELWQHLGEGNLEASGVDQGGRVSQIPAREWSYLQLASRAKGADFLVFSHQNTVAVYDNITIPRAAILAHWPAAGQTQAAELTVGVVPTLPRRDRKLCATLQAIAALNADGVLTGMSAKERCGAVNDWLREKAKMRVSPTTILRALSSS